MGMGEKEPDSHLMECYVVTVSAVGDLISSLLLLLHSLHLLELILFLNITPLIKRNKFTY